MEHAHFDGTALVESKAGITWTAPGTAPAQQAFAGFPGVTRHGAGPFAAAQAYKASGDATVAALDQGMIACAIVKPDYDATTATADKVFFARGTEPGANPDGSSGAPGTTTRGWVLSQTGSTFAFHYNYVATDGRTVRNRAYLPTFFASQITGTNGDPNAVQVVPNSGPLNPSLVVVCGGRAANNIRIAVNGFEPTSTYSSTQQDVGPAGSTRPLSKGSEVLTVGGLEAGGVAFGGRVYEVAVWNEPGTPENIQKKLALVQGLPTDGTVYKRNREAPFFGADATADRQSATGYHTAWRNGPRYEAGKGMLFGMQSWNRVGDYGRLNVGAFPTYVVTPGENLGAVPITGVVQPSGGDPAGDYPGWAAAGTSR